MGYDEFIKRIQERGELRQFGAAERAASAVLEVLGEELTGDQADSIAQQLPTHIRDAVLQNNKAEGFGLNEFVQRVSVRENVGVKDAEKHVRAVFSVLPDVISLEKAHDAVSRLPDDIRELFMSERTALSGTGL